MRLASLGAICEHRAMALWKRVSERLLEHRIFISVLATSCGLELWFLPGAVARNGGGAFLLLWLGMVVMVTLPVLLFEIAMGGSLQGTISEGLRKASRRSEWVAWMCHVLAILAAAMAAIFCAWCLNLLFEAVFCLVDNHRLPWMEAPQGPDAYITGEVMGAAADRNEPFLLQLGHIAPVGRVLIALGVVWFGVLWIAVKGISNYRRLARLLLPIIGLLLLLGLVAQLNRIGADYGILRIFTPEWSALGRLETWTEAVCLALLTLPLGTGLYPALTGIALRRYDSAGTTIFGLALALGAHCLVLLTVGAAFGAYCVGSRVLWDVLPLEGTDAILIAVPVASESEIHAPWISSLLLVFGLTPLALLFFCFCSGMTLAPALAWSRHRRRNLWDASWVFIVFPVSLSAVFASSAGHALWQGLLECLRYLLVPLVLAILMPLACAVVGDRGLSGHLTAYTLVRVGTLWRFAVRWGIPVLLVAVAAERSYHHLAARSFDAEACILYFVPLPLLLLAAWLLKQYGNRKESR